MTGSPYLRAAAQRCGILPPDLPATHPPQIKPYPHATDQLFDMGAQPRHTGTGIAWIFLAGCIFAAICAIGMVLL